jgi:hypothetical protein
MKGMSTVRTDIKGLIQQKPAIIFDIQDTKTWSRAGSRAAMPEVKALLDNSYFSGPITEPSTPATRLASNFRHSALRQVSVFLQILISINLY